MRFTQLTSAVFGVLVAGSAMAAATTVTEQSYDFLPKCEKQVATIVVGNIGCKASACQSNNGGALGGQMAALLAMSGQSIPDYSQIGTGMAGALTTALKATGCFEVQEREALDELRKEMELAGIKVEAKAADFMILGSVTSLESSKAKSNIGGGLIPIVGSFSRDKSSVAMAMDLRVVEVRKASVLSSKTFNANSANVSWGIKGAGLVGAMGLFGGHSENKGSPVLDRVAADTVVQSVNHIVELLAKSAVTYRPAPPVAKVVEAKQEANTADTGLGEYSY